MTTSNSESKKTSPQVPVLLRRLSAEDLAGVIALEHELFPDDAWSPEMFADEVAQSPDSRCYLVAETRANTVSANAVPANTVPGNAGPANTVLAGYAGVMFLPGGQSDVLTVAVREDTWGQGIGSALLGALVDAARDRGCTEMFLEVRADNDRAHGLYLRRGFTDLGIRRGYYQPSGMDAITMRKDLRRD
jgi:ribosomal-protein-alanine N-acetyltransferase